MYRKLWLAVWMAAPLVYGQQAQVGSFANVKPGTSLKAEVDLNLGEPLRKIEDNLYEYAPPRGKADTARVVAAFFPGSRVVSRVDVYLKSPLDAELLRTQFGTRVMSRDRAAGETEELFYPKLNALIFSGKGGSVPVIAIGYLSPRLMADAFAERAQALRTEKRFDEAQTEADKAVLVDPDYARGYLEQAQCWLELKNENEAIVSLIAASKAKYDSRNQALAHVRLGQLYWRSRNWPDKAQVEFEQASALGADSDEVQLGYGQFLASRKQTQQAVAHLSTAARLNRGLTVAWLQLGDQYLAANDPGRAVESYQKGLQANPQDFPLSQALGNALLEDGKTEAARHQIEETLRAQPGDAVQRLLMARCWAALGKKKEAIHWIQQAVAAGFKDRGRLANDRLFSPLQKDGDFKKILQRLS